MEWQTIRSWRDRGFWLPLVGSLLFVSAVAGSTQLWAHRHIQELQSLRASSPEAAAAAAQRALRLLGQTVCGFSLGVAALLFRYFQLGLREQRLPPSGWWSLGARRVVVGPGARCLCRLGFALSLVLAAAGVGCLLVVQHLLETLGLAA
jgi:hypothetical protein